MFINVSLLVSDIHLKTIDVQQKTTVYEESLCSCTYINKGSYFYGNYWKRKASGLLI